MLSQDEGDRFKGALKYLEMAVSSLPHRDVLRGRGRDRDTTVISMKKELHGVHAYRIPAWAFQLLNQVYEPFQTCARLIWRVIWHCFWQCC